MIKDQIDEPEVSDIPAAKKSSMLVRLLYASRIIDVSPSAIEAILAKSRANNTACGITGILCHGQDVFLQALEGGRSTVNELYGRIQRDPRHKEITLLHFEEIEERLFGGWTMGQVNLTKAHLATLLRFSARPKLDPCAVSSKVSLALLRELVQTAAVGMRG